MGMGKGNGRGGGLERSLLWTLWCLNRWELNIYKGYLIIFLRELG